MARGTDHFEDGSSILCTISQPYPEAYFMKTWVLIPSKPGKGTCLVMQVIKKHPSIKNNGGYVDSEEKGTQLVLNNDNLKD